MVFWCRMGGQERGLMVGGGQWWADRLEAAGATWAAWSIQPCPAPRTLAGGGSWVNLPPSFSASFNIRARFARYQCLCIFPTNGRRSPIWLSGQLTFLLKVSDCLPFCARFNIRAGLAWYQRLLICPTNVKGCEEKTLLKSFFRRFEIFCVLVQMPWITNSSKKKYSSSVWLLYQIYQIWH